MPDYNKFLAELGENELFKDDFLCTWDKSTKDNIRIVYLAKWLKTLRDSNCSTNVFDNGLAVSIFRDKSTRTRFSYASAANLLGLGLQDMDESKSQVSHGETVRETANMISFLSEFIGIRDDMYPGLGHSYMTEVAEALNEGYEKGVLPQRPGIINLQSDIDHPTQTLSDLIHLTQEFGSIESLKGKKFVMSWAYSPAYGKPMSVPQGLIGLMTRFGMDVTLAHPEGYELMPEVMAVAEKQAKESGGKFTLAHDMGKAVMNADIVYPKSWAPLHIMMARTNLLKSNNTNALDKLEKEGLEHNAKYKDWTYDEKMMKNTMKGNALYMHCLPADISGVNCEQGEVSSGVFEKFRIKTYMEAGWKPYVIAAMMLAQKFRQPEKLLRQLENRAHKRIEV